MKIEVKKPYDCPFRENNEGFIECSIVQNTTGQMNCEDINVFPDSCPILEEPILVTRGK